MKNPLHTCLTIKKVCLIFFYSLTQLYWKSKMKVICKNRFDAKYKSKNSFISTMSNKIGINWYIWVLSERWWLLVFPISFIQNFSVFSQWMGKIPFGDSAFLYLLFYSSWSHSSILHLLFEGLSCTFELSRSNLVALDSSELEKS